MLPLQREARRECRRGSRRMLRRQDGMTLIELLIAVAIAGILITITYTLMNAQTHAINNSRNTSEMEDNVRVAMDALARDVRNAGFLVPDQSYALRVENNCGATTTADGYGGIGSGGVDYTGGGTFAVNGGGAAGNTISAVGQILGDNSTFLTQGAFNNGCPNGSDRLTIVTRPSNAYPLALSSSTFPNWVVSCNPAGTSANDCTNIVQFGGIPGGSCKCTPGVNCISAYGNICNSPNGIGDPFSCSLATVDYSSCVNAGGGTCLQAASCTLVVTSVSNNPGGGGTPIQPPGTSSFQQYATRTYQLMDLDGDGTTELVFSDDATGKLENAGAPSPAIWNPVANYIDDLQFAFAYSANPTAFISANLWNFNPAGASLGCTENAGKGLYCLNTDLAGTGAGAAAPSGPGVSNPPIAVRITVVGRPQKKEIGVTGQASAYYRGNVEDNVFAAATQQLFTQVQALPLWNNGPAACFGTRTAGNAGNCGCGPSGTAGGALTNSQNYLTCTGNGNAQGYRRRVLTEVVALRNVTGNL